MFGRIQIYLNSSAFPKFMPSGKFIVLEGLDGSGTTTQAGRLAGYLFARDKLNRVLLTREPTRDSLFGQEIERRLKGCLLPGEEVVDDAGYWASLFINDRRWHLENVIRPALQSGQQVVCDRHKMSTLAYQSAQGGDMDYLLGQHAGFDSPDLTLLLDVSAKVALKRRKAETGGAEYFENFELQKEIHRQYLLAVEKLSPTEKVVLINGHPAIEKVAQKIIEEVELLYGRQ